MADTGTGTVAAAGFRVTVGGLPEPPPPSLDPYLDAAVRCFVRHGVSRTSVQDVAAEMKVNRTTVYRQVGNVGSMLRLVKARALNRIVVRALTRAQASEISARSVADLMTELIEMVRADPVVRKVLADEMHLVGTLLEDLPEMIDRVVASVTAPMEAAMEAGILARRDARVVAEWMIRIAATCIVAPPPGDLGTFLAEVVVPVLTPPIVGGGHRSR